MKNIYNPLIVDYYHNPRHKGVLKNPDFNASAKNPMCGDAVVIYGILGGSTLQMASFCGEGCMISQACASILLEKVINRPIAEILAFTQQDLLDLLGMQFGPGRLRCVTLALEALHIGLKSYA